MRVMTIALCGALAWPIAVCAENQIVGGERVQVGSGETRFVAVSVDPAVSGRLLAASSATLYESVDGGAQWQQRFRVPGHAQVQRVAVGPSNPSVILVATTQGLYGSFDHGTQWSQVFRGQGEREADCRHVAFHPLKQATALLGTGQGLFLSADEGRHWTELTIPAAARDIVSLAFHPTDPDRIYLVTPESLFIGDLSTGTWQQRFSLIRAEAPEVEEPAVFEADPLETAEENGSLHRLSAVAVDPQQPATVYLATSRGLQMSTDEGKSWQALTTSGLPSAAVTRLVPQHHSPLALYAATAQGVATYAPAQERWTMLSQGLAANAVNDLATTVTHLWAATDEGLFRYELPPEPFADSPPPSARELLSNFVHEPSIGEVREAAIRYAEVDPRKIQAWRQQARWRALVPKFTFSGDTNLTDFRHWDAGTSPDSLLKGERDVDWTSSISWELADLIWSTDQTSIDVRSKLMVELRDDIVDEVTRTYFERRRLQIVLLTNPPSDQHVMLEKELKLQELTAMIDGLTGGYFSKRMKVDGNP